ncbi:MAG: FAD-dependent oxidoreductase, partial [Rhodocyclaceae bacterium]
RLASGEEIAADAVVSNADVGALADGHFGPAAARATRPVPPSARSLSALTWSLCAVAEDFPLVRHTVFFSGDYAAEFDDLMRRRRLPAAPTVYVCAQDRGDHPPAASGSPERLFLLVNAPPTGDTHDYDGAEIEQCEDRTFDLLARCGLRLSGQVEPAVRTTPTEFNRLFPATGGALYGQASHGWQASFRRPGSRSRIPGLYLSGGSTHPGAGVPMAALSGRLAASSLLADFASTTTFPRTATSGGTSTP